MALAMPSLSPADNILAARFSLPANPRVAFAVYNGHYDPIESARRTVLASNSDLPVPTSILVGVEPGTDPLLYLFLISPQDALDTAQERLLSFTFDHLTCECSVSRVCWDPI